jgi:uncharacterized protein (DUF3820 family)
MTKDKIFEPVLDEIHNEDIKEFAKYLIDNECVEYFWVAAASSSGKYHPAYSLGEMGLARHTVAVVRFLLWILELEYMSEKVSDRKRDLLIIACLVHDWRKLGEPDKPKKSTVFLHPILAANMIRKYEGQFLDEGEIEFIASCVETHMGQWCTNKRSSEELPKISNAFQFYVHLADYLSSRRDLDMQFDDWEKPELPDINIYTLDFGRYKGQKLLDVVQNDPDYVEWMRRDYQKWPIRDLLKQL